MTKNKHVLHIIKSPSFQSDGRLQKWINQLEDRGLISDVFIIEDNNTPFVQSVKQSTVNAGTLFSRKFFKQRKGYLLKVIEYFFKTKSFIKNHDSEIIVFHDVQQYLNILYRVFFYRNSKRRIIWDLHELPHELFLRYNMSRRILKLILNNVDCIIYTNKERCDYLKSKINGLKENKFFILNNFPDQIYLTSIKDESSKVQFDNGRPYILWLGAAIPTRNFGSFLKAYQHFVDKYNLVILGRVDPLYALEIDKLKQEGKAVVDFVSQSEIINYIDSCFTSVVLYNAETPNNYYCEPNRLYQLISRNKPVIVGSNPTMADLITKYKNGYILDDDGRNPENITNGLKDIEENYDKYWHASRQIDCTNVFSWENQVNEIIDYLQSKK